MSDLFSAQAEVYAQSRPGYPPALFAHLSSLAPGHHLAWDCATGNGQAALGLAEHFETVVASDISAEQLQHATPHPRIQYRQFPAEKPDLADHSVDIITVAIALHWFDLPAFYREVRRVAVPNGILAAWAYDQPVITPEIDPLMRKAFYEILGPYWPPERELVNQRYQTLPFPFQALDPPSFAITEDWDYARLVGYLHSWSALQRYLCQHGQNPLTPLLPHLATAWGDPTVRRRVTFPLFMRVGRVLSDS